MSSLRTGLEGKKGRMQRPSFEVLPIFKALVTLGELLWWTFGGLHEIGCVEEGLASLFMTNITSFICVIQFKYTF